MKRFATACLSVALLLSAPQAAFAQDPAGKQEIERVIDIFLVPAPTVPAP